MLKGEAFDRARRLRSLLCCWAGLWIVAHDATPATATQIQICTSEPNSQDATALVGCPRTSLAWGPRTATDLVRTQDAGGHQLWSAFNKLAPTAQVVPQSGGWAAVNSLSVPQPWLTTPAPPATPYAAPIKLDWTAPNQNTDGSALTDLDHFNVWQGPDVAHLVQIASPPASSPTYTTPALFEGVYNFAVSAVNTSKIESARSASVAVTITKPAAPQKIPASPPVPKAAVISPQ
jgi:hypothetical protein